MAGCLASVHVRARAFLFTSNNPAGTNMYQTPARKPCTTFGRSKVVLCRAMVSLLGLLALPQAPAKTASGNSAETGNSSSVEVTPLQPRPPRQGEPVQVERRLLPPGTVRDPRRRMTFYPGGIRSDCQPWRFEVSARPDGEIIFQVNEPADRQVVLAGLGDDRSQEFVLGDPDCNFRVKIERGK